MFHIYVTSVFSPGCFWWQFCENQLLMDAHFQLNVITNVQQAVCGCLGALTVYTHARFRAMVCVLTGNDATAEDVLYQNVARCSYFFVAYLAATLFSYFLTQCLTIPTYHLPSTSAHTSSEEGLVFFFCTRWIFSPAMWPSLLIPIFFTFL